jgi:hypothetical protein
MDALFKMSNAEIEVAVDVVRSFQRNKSIPKSEAMPDERQQSLEGVKDAVDNKAVV